METGVLRRMLKRCAAVPAVSTTCRGVDADLFSRLAGIRRRIDVER